MADVTDAAFRHIIAKYGKPDVMWTEFVSADGLALAPEEGKRKLLLDLKYSESERPIVAQFFTSSPEHMRLAAQLAASLGFDGVDINMGCPDKGVEKQGAGAALMKNPKLARELIRAAKEGAPSLPISIKTRIGWNSPELETWLLEILKENPAVVTIHARTRKEMSKVPARWEFVKRAVEIRNQNQCPTLILGNGDVKDIDDAKKKVEETGCDGVMLGRAIFGNPWLFSRGKRSGLENEDLRPGIEERLAVLVEHIKLFDELLGGVKNFSIMKKHFKAYISGFDGAADLRGKLMETESATEAVEILCKYN
ncbi:MAG: tRNA-dihydrouridine synthase [Parcubacteria group bacterium GW2011_GWB1_49_7]|nr:MAG: tRNA-dihydrouridine synthase [Parcubacteria group bacterium GW2011_GWA1_47_10]KKW10017.1 MAG: tRNA-dihydrouridine synthase [Parcubacteria group bacterium GW2011_GWB1_49_7]